MVFNKIRRGLTGLSLALAACSTQYSRNYEFSDLKEKISGNELIDTIKKEILDLDHTYRRLPSIDRSASNRSVSETLKFEQECREKRINPYHFDEKVTNEKLKKLNDEELSLVKLTLDYFKSKENCNRIGKQVLNDVNDKHTEFGGGIYLRNNELTFKFAPSREMVSNNTYVIPDLVKTNLVGIFHLHASSEDSTRSAGPSGDPTNAKKKGDISASTKMPGVVITKLSGDKFNIDIYCVKDLNSMGGRDAVVLDLGNHSFDRGDLSK